MHFDLFGLFLLAVSWVQFQIYIEAGKCSYLCYFLCYMLNLLVFYVLEEDILSSCGSIAVFSLLSNKFLLKYKEMDLNLINFPDTLMYSIRAVFVC